MNQFLCFKAVQSGIMPLIIGLAIAVALLPVVAKLERKSKLRGQLPA